MNKYLVLILILAIVLRLNNIWEMGLGVATVLGVWFLANQIMPNQKWGQEIAALFLAVSPWHISLPLKVSVGVIGVIGGILVLMRLFKGRWLLPGVAILILIGNQIISPLVVNLDNAKDSVWLTDQQRREHREGYNGLISKTFHNKGVNYSLSFVEHWGEHFSADFLFITGNNLMYLSDLVFLIIGIVTIIKRGDWGKWGVVVVWLIVAPINSSLNFAPPDPVKTSLMLVPLIMISSYGAFVLFETVQRYVKGVTIRR